MSKKRHKKVSDSQKSFPALELNAVVQRDLLINAWKSRDKLYQNLFGDYTQVSPENYAPPKPIDIANKNHVDSPPKASSPESDNAFDPSLEGQELAVLAYGPDPQRPYWTYITAGLSSPWLQEEPQEVSGFGLEIMIKSPNEAQWPAQILKSMAFYIFNHAGTLSPGVRIGLNSPIVADSDSKLRNIAVWYADEAPDCWYQLPSGGFGIFAAIGITDDELKFAESIEEYGTWCIQQVLRQTGQGQVTDPNRPSTMEHPNIKTIISLTTDFAQKFQATASDFSQ